MTAHVLDTARMLAAELPGITARTDRARILHELAEVDERVRGDELAAAKGYLAAFNARASFRVPLEGLIRIYARRRGLANLAKLYDALAKAATNDRERAVALVLRGELLEDRLDDTLGGRAEFEQAVEADPGCRTAWLALERHALRHGDRDLLARALAGQAAVTHDANRKARLLIELASEHARRGDPASLADAARCLRDAAALPLGRWRTLLELERFGEETRRMQDVVFALEGRAVLARDVARGESFQGGSGTFAIARLGASDAARDVAADLWARAARLRLTALEDPDGARGAMDQALLLKPDDPRYHYFAMILADQSNDIDRASENASWLLAHGFGDASTRAALQFRVAETAAIRGDLSAAMKALRASLELDPSSAASLGAVIEQLVATGDGVLVTQEFDRLAESADDPRARAALRRVGAVYALALSRDAAGAARRFRLACDDDPGDVVSRRALVALLGQRPRDEDGARALASAIDALLPMVTDEDERISLLLRSYWTQRHELHDLRAAAATAERLVDATGGDPWAMEAAAQAWAAVGSHAAAARWAEALASADGLPGGSEDAVAWRAIAARWRWAAGDEAGARELCLAAQREAPGDAYLAGLALGIAAAGKEHAAVLDVARRKADASELEAGSRWLLLAHGLLARDGADDLARRALEAAAERSPESPAVRAAMLATTRWRGDVEGRARIAEAAIEAEACGPEELALGLELALARAFLEHDVPAAAEVLERVAARDGGNATVVALLHALARGALEGPDSEGTVAALQGVLQTLPSSDPLRGGIELEVARALGASASTRDQAAAARDLVDEDQPHLVAPRLLALLDAVQHRGREDLPAALTRVADFCDPATAGALRGAALTALRALGREGDARELAHAHPALPASVVARSEMTAGLEQAEEYAAGLRARMELAVGSTRASVARAAASWTSVAGGDGDALLRAEAILREHPTDLVAQDVRRVAGRRLGLWPTVASACEALAERVHSPSRAGALWEEAGVVALDELRDAARAERCLRSALEATPTRTIAYRKLREVLQARKDTAGLEALVTRRLELREGDDELVDLSWEQARLRRALGRREEALASAEEVVRHAPGHVAARALVAEVHAASGRLAETADALVALASCAEAPESQRRVARLGAIDLFDLRLRRPAKAIEQLEALLADGRGDDATVERGVEIAMRAELWEAALRFARLAVERATAAPARSAAMLRVAHLYRDRLRDPDAARAQAATAHEEFPGSLEILRTLQGLSDADDRPRHARRAVDALRDVLRNDGVSTERVLGVAEAARSGGDGVLERAALRLARAMGADVNAQGVGVPGGASLRDPALTLRYRNPADSDRAVVLFETVLPDLAESAGISTSGFRVGRAERIRGSHPARSAVEPYVRAAGFLDFELYLGGPDEGRIAVVPGSTIAVVLGRRVPVPLDDESRFELVRWLLLVGRGVAGLAHEPVEANVANVMAALAYAELPVAGGTQRFEARLRPVAKAVSRRVRRSIAESGRVLAASAGAWDELSRAARLMRSTARRGALAVTGAVDAAFRDLARAEGAPEGISVAELVLRSQAARELALFAVSDALVQICRETAVDRR